MDLIDSETLQWTRGAEHRSDGVMFKTLFTGREGEPNNYWFSLVHIDQYFAPPHKHNFDQVRIMLEGGFGFGERVQPEGTVGYFTEGLTYTQTSIGKNVHLLLQCEGGSRSPFLSLRQIQNGVTELAKVGKFSKGRYRANGDDLSPDRDGFEVVWEHVIGRPVAYDKPRFDEPLITDPTRYAFVPEKQPGLWRKRLMRVTERDLAISIVRADAGSKITFSAADQVDLCFILDGEGLAGPSNTELTSYHARTAFRLLPGEEVLMTPQKITDILTIELPR